MVLLPPKSSRLAANEPSASARGDSKAVLAARATLETVVGALSCPAFVVDGTGQLLLANANGKKVLDRDGHSISTSLARIVAGDLSNPSWELVPLSTRKHPPGFLVLLKAPGQDITPAESARSAKHPKVDQAIVRASGLWKLTRRQKEVLELLACGLTNGLVAEMLNIGDRAVEYHVSAILDKAGADNRTMLIAKLLDL